VVFQLLRTKQNVLLLALIEDPVVHDAMELDAFLEHGQAKGRLDVSPVEEPVEEEVGRVGGTENPQIEYLMVVTHLPDLSSISLYVM